MFRLAARRIRIGATVFVFLVLLFVVASLLVPSWFIGRYVEPTEAPPGDAARFDPVQALPGVGSYVGDGARLVSFNARFVRSDGTLDLQAAYTPGPTAVYTFTKPAAPPEGGPPVGTGAQDGFAWRRSVVVTVSRPGQRFFVKKQSGSFSSSYNYVTKGMRKTEQGAQFARVPSDAPPPVCALQGLWERAIAAGAPGDGVADIVYDGRTYAFKVYGRPLAFAFGQDCAMIR